MAAFKVESVGRTRMPEYEGHGGRGECAGGRIGQISENLYNAWRSYYPSRQLDAVASVGCEEYDEWAETECLWNV